MAGPSLEQLREAAAACTDCDLYENATQTVFGEGPASADLMLVGEQPGDREDLQGHPFVGPAGRVLAQALDEAGLDPSQAYVTNVVKHFKFTQRGKRRIHRTPSALQIRACRHWLDSELTAVDPKVIVCLGATAGKALMGPAFRVTQQRGEVFGWPDGNPQRRIMGTIHPSAILRMDDADRESGMAHFVADLRVAARLLG
ncbi:MAG: UdgX family uracil-DNA binding protein [Egibacteraceae bacterium]